jgi:N6-adenosine-specific RNA methylase IME4
LNSIAKRLGHPIETMMIYSKGDITGLTKYRAINEVIIAPLTGQSSKPLHVYSLMEKIIQDNHFLEIFAREHNVKPNFVSVGNQVRAFNK